MARSIALVGKFASGKTTIASGLRERGWQSASFAAPLKQLASTVYNDGEPISKDGVFLVYPDEGQGVRPILISGRMLLQQLGQSVKKLDQLFWVNWLLNTIDPENNTYIIEDCRFVYEAEALRHEGFAIVRVQTPDEVRLERYELMYGRRPNPDELNHPSETEVDNIVADMQVDGTADVQTIINALVEEYS